MERHIRIAESPAHQMVVSLKKKGLIESAI